MTQLLNSLARCASLTLLVLIASMRPAAGQSLGPVHVELPAGGASYEASLSEDGNAAFAAPVWTMSTWLELNRSVAGEALVGGFGAPEQGPRRYFALRDGKPAFVTEGGALVAAKQLSTHRWHHLVAVAEHRRIQLYVDGRRVATAEMALLPVAPQVVLGPRTRPSIFAGRLAHFVLQKGCQGAAAIRRMAQRVPDAPLLAFQTGAPSWPVQLQQKIGEPVPQRAATLPVSRAPLGKPHKKPAPKRAALNRIDDASWSVDGWRLLEAPKVHASGEEVSRAGYGSSAWLVATVPGTVLTTLLDRGIYPDPAFGLNNLAIPEKLARQDYWYRTEFERPDALGARQVELEFGGINYTGEIWLNGTKLGESVGAFVRGRFDVTGKLRPGRNALAVRVRPPPHPGIPHEQSLRAGDGNNGGMLMLDGPTFVASEGWDWIPGIRDRNTGLWQGVTLRTTSTVSVGDVQVVTTLPRADNAVAHVELTVPLRNHAESPVDVRVRAAFDDVVVEKKIALAPSEQRAVIFAPQEFAQLVVANPRLWWPNGYGEPALHDLRVTAHLGDAISDHKDVRFGMRQVTYDLSLMDEEGELRRLTVDLSQARKLAQQIVDTSHTGIRKSAAGWVMSLLPGRLKSPAVAPLADAPGLAPHLVLRVNGVRIAARGGNIGMDDFLKRVERTRLEPMFRLHKEAHLNIVRNWVGQDTEETFFELADAYGMMVLNDFWESTQDVNLETDKPQIFLDNARDVVRRYRNHPSIVLWFGRNEGVPQPALNDALEALVRAEDGTRLYMGASNTINLQGSGPYNWQPEDTYFTTHAMGFSVEVGTPSFPTLETWQSTMAPADLWPISDAWAYHDWHQTGNGAVAGYLSTLRRRFGEPTSLADFERKAQLVQYDAYRAIFEGFNAGLWQKNSGRMLWMTQPAWPSAAWNIFSSDYDTHAGFYGVQKACEPLHVQMNLPTGEVVLVNNSLQGLDNVHVAAHIESLAGVKLLDAAAAVRVAPQELAPAFRLDLDALDAHGVALVRLTAHDAAGRNLSRNVYVHGPSDEALRALDSVPQVPLDMSVRKEEQLGETLVHVTLANHQKVPALAAKMTVLGRDGKRALPAYPSDNYISLLPGETQEVVIRLPGQISERLEVGLRGFNIKPARVRVR